MGIKEAIIYGKKKYYNSFFDSSYQFTNSSGKISFYQQAPRHILEFFAISIILLFILILSYFGGSNFNEILPILSIYIFAGYKLLPILQNVYAGLVQIRAHYPALIKIENELYQSKNYSLNEKNDEKNKINFKQNNPIKFKDVDFFYKDSNKRAVTSLNFEINQNTINYLVGESGSGKSTILDLILGLIYPQEGEILLGSMKLSESNSNFGIKILVMLVRMFLLDDTIKNNICFSDSEEKIDEEKLKERFNYLI